MRGELGRLQAALLAVGLVAALPGLGTALAETSGPDIGVHWVLADPRNPDVGQEVTFTANVTNAGDEATGGFDVAFEVYHYDTEETERFDVANVADLSPGEHVRVESQAWNGSEGRYAVRAVADVADDVNETDEQNNVDAEQFTVGEPLADLEPHLQVHDRHASTQDPVYVEHGVSNHGQGEAGPFWTEIRLDGEVLDRSYHEGMSSHIGWVTTTAVGPIEEPGQHELSFVVDADDDVNETDETDNRVVESLTVYVPPDPAVASLDVDKQRLRTDVAEGPANPVAGQQITATFEDTTDSSMRYWTELTVEVCPDEGAVFTPFTVRCELLRNELVSHDELARGYTVQETWDTAGKAGDWTVCASVGADVDPQLDYANNEVCRDTFVLVGGTGLGGLAVDWPR